ncbi:hypothetical protein B6S12_02805 [Helicobacter valdiviensis]|uniref:Uncharacterized protein n=1 Tax=Helicobacter valdiviensis TaxID=1458358 RepID=A0A2W6NI98_9HELI|nr:hypothetical protein [Helicobacter valdiviensis]PZT48590.1 hypothetical protein B6S12_02805 [Helicobacter valdiviensis]
MKLIQLIRPFFYTVIVGIEIDSRLCTLTLRYYKNGKITDTIQKSYKTTPGQFPIQAVRFINKTKIKHPFIYLATLPTSIVQGTICKDNEEGFHQYGINPKEIEYVKNYHWYAYVGKDGISETKSRFLKTGVDFIISPFMVLYALSKELFQEGCKLYVLFQKAHITMIVTKLGKGVLFGAYYVLESDIESQINLTSNNLKSGLDELEKIDVEQDLQDELKGIDEVDELENLEDDNLIKELKGENPQEKEEETQNTHGNFDDFSRVSSAAKFIQLALNEFYTNEIYESEFVDEIVIFNPHDINKDTLKYIQNVTMLNINIRSCNVSEILAHLGYESFKYFQTKGLA